MFRHIVKFSLSLILSAVTVSGCHKEDVPQESLQESGEAEMLSIAFGTRSAPGVTPDVTDGSAFSDLLVILTDKENRLVKPPCYKSYPYSRSSENDIQREVPETHPSEDVINFRKVQIGEYKVFAFANISDTEFQDPQALISNEERTLSVGDVLDPDRLLREQAPDILPCVPRTDGGKATRARSLTGTTSARCTSRRGIPGLTPWTSASW